MGEGVCSSVFVRVAVVMCAAGCRVSIAALPGPLVVHPDNPRYLMVKDDPARKVVYVTGSHTWAEFQTYQSEGFDYADWLDSLGAWGHNFFRGWHWEDDYYNPRPYEKAGNGKYNLHRYNSTYFDRLRSRIIDAANHDPPYYVSVMLFQGWSVDDKNGLRTPDPWPHHPYNLSNNNNGINGDPNGDGNGTETQTLDIPAVTALQEAYVEHTIDLLNDLDNIIWEIGNECHSGSVSWQYHMIDHIKSYEATRPKQHLVWMNGNATDLFASQCHADIVSPGGTIYRTDPPASTGQKVVISDSDHQGPLQVTHPWAWRNFTRGNLPILMDCKYQGLTWWTGGGFNPNNAKWQNMRDALRITLACAERMDLASTVPQSATSSAPSSTRYCLYGNGTEYLVYQPASGQSFTVDLPAAEYDYEWVHPLSGPSGHTGTFDWAGGNRSFTAPFGGDAVLHVKHKGDLSAVGDFDHDRDVDQADFGLFQICFSGASTALTPGCEYADLDRDATVDEDDFVIFLACLSGPGVPQTDAGCLPD